jgi:hypothetical protein
MDDSNAALSKTAKDHTAIANQATSDAEGGKGTHSQAASAHEQAAWSNKRAGNATQANKHSVAAMQHREKAVPENAAKGFARQMSSHADNLSRKADMKTAGGDAKDEGKHEGDSVSDPRTSSDLHQAAKTAHSKASKACSIAGMDTEAKYHEGKEAEHDAKADI